MPDYSLPAWLAGLEFRSVFTAALAEIDRHIWRVQPERCFHLPWIRLSVMHQSLSAPQMRGTLCLSLRRGRWSVLNHRSFSALHVAE